MAAVTNKQIYDEIQKLNKLILGNGEVGLLERDRNQEREIEEHSVSISEIKKNCESAQSSKWKNLPLYKKVLIATTIIAFIKANDLVTLGKAIIDWVAGTG